MSCDCRARGQILTRGRNIFHRRSRDAMRVAVDPNDWMHDFYGTTRGEDYGTPTVVTVPDTPPPPTPDKSLRHAIEEGAKDDAEDTLLPRLSLPPHAAAAAAAASSKTNPPPAYLSSSDRRRFVGHSPTAICFVGHAPAAISVAHRQQYSQAQQALYRDAGKAEVVGDAIGLTALAKVAGKRAHAPKKKKKARHPPGVSERWVTTKNGRVLKLKAKPKKHGGRTALSRSWPSTRDPSSSSSNSFYREDYSERQAERAEMERGDRK